MVVWLKIRSLAERKIQNGRLSFTWLNICRIRDDDFIPYGTNRINKIDRSETLSQNFVILDLYKDKLL